ncbi:carbohydrate binding-domain-containing protein [Mycena floridula]|nr:carbohydrate binding-domain-containing protein [Mycena floridula]
MAKLISLVLAALAFRVVTAQTCGSTNYNPTQYTCFNNSTLCPIVNGIEYDACGNACYSRTQYTCIDESTNFMCPIINGSSTYGCGGKSCYMAGQYTCDDGALNPFPSGCIGLDQSNPICDDNVCEFGSCCPGLLDVADRCRDPCDFTPGCATYGE